MRCKACHSVHGRGVFAAPSSGPAQGGLVGAAATGGTAARGDWLRARHVARLRRAAESNCLHSTKGGAVETGCRDLYGVYILLD